MAAEKATGKKPGGGRYKRAFFTGLGTLLPTILTLYIIMFCYSFVQEKIAQPINDAIASVLKTEPAREWYWSTLLRKQDWQLDAESTTKPADVPPEYADIDDVPFETMVDAHVPTWLGFVISIFLVLGVGFAFKGYLGRQLVRMAERGLLRLPVIKVIYPYAKQVTEFFFKEKKQISYDSAVLVEYPRAGIYSIGFITNAAFQGVMDHTGEEMVSIFIPSSPTPITGYTIQVKRSELLPVNVSVDEAIRYTISGGVILPPGQLPPLSLKTKKLTRPDPPGPGSPPDERPPDRSSDAGVPESTQG